MKCIISRDYSSHPHKIYWITSLLFSTVFLILFLALGFFSDRMNEKITKLCDYAFYTETSDALQPYGLVLCDPLMREKGET